MPFIRKRNISEEGLLLYNVCMNNKSKGFLKNILHNLFWTKYDDKLLEISNNCYKSSHTLFSHLNAKIEYIFANGLRNMVKIILTPLPKSRNKLHSVRQNYLFHLDLILKSHEKGDYNTVILCLLALQHPYITRLKIKSNKKTKRTFDKMNKEYGTIPNGFTEHFYKILENDCNDSEIPSIVLYLLYCQELKNVSNVSLFQNENISENKITRLHEIYELYYYFNLRKEFLSELYKSKVNDSELYELSNNIKPFLVFLNETINPLNEYEIV